MKFDAISVMFLQHQQKSSIDTVMCWWICPSSWMSLCQSKVRTCLTSLPTGLPIKLYKNTLCPSPAPVCVHVSVDWPWIIQRIFIRLSAFVCPDLSVLAACHHPLSAVKSASRKIGQKKSLGLNIAHILVDSQNITDWDCNGKNIH